LSPKDVKELPLFRTIGIPDKGPKVRTVTMGNYFLQRSMKSFHDSIMETLRSIPEDGTHFQSIAAQAVKDWTAKGIQPFCYDLTSATDLYPEIIQFITMNHIYPGIAREWHSIIRKVKSKDTQRNIWFEFGVGQPMGLYSSWPAFTLSHHMLIRFAFSNVRKDYRFNYYIIGDDIAIKCPIAAREYERLILGLGVPISKSKSVIPDNIKDPTNKVGELAKRYFVNGVEITPVRPYQLESLSGASWPLMLEFTKILIDRWGLESTDIIRTLDTSYVKGSFLTWVDKTHRKKLLLIALQPPLRLPLTGVSPNWWPKENTFSLAFECAKKFVISDKVQQIVEDICYISDNMKVGIGTELLLPNDSSDILVHPLHKVLTLLKEDVKRICRLYDSEELSLKEDVYTLGINIELLLSMVNDGKTYKDYKTLKVKRQLATARAQLDTWAQMINEYSFRPVDKDYPVVKSSKLFYTEEDWLDY
jgi:hypothetical protein